MADREPIMQFFAPAHQPPRVQGVSGRFAALAEWVQGHLPSSAERTVALRKLLEAQDAAVRAALADAGEAAERLAPALQAQGVTAAAEEGDRG